MGTGVRDLGARVRGVVVGGVEGGDMYQYTSKGYKFVDYEAPDREPEMPVRMKILGTIYDKGFAAASARQPRIAPYKRSDFATVWDLGYEEFLCTPNPNPCPQCDGDGYVIVGWDDDAYENVEDTCPRCGGSGERGM